MYYPLFIDLKNKKVLVIGGGRVGSKRALYLLKAGALVTVISKEFDKKLLSIRNKNLKLIKKEINNRNINKINFKDYFLIIISTNNKNINEKISNKIKKINKKNNILVCRADKHSAGDVIFPSVSKIKNNIFAFTTLGKSPKLSKKVKDLIDNVRKV